MNYGGICFYGTDIAIVSLKYTKTNIWIYFLFILVKRVWTQSPNI
jgi:hypothetical protein